ncbi:hypothetical protein ACL07V_29075 [Streptomyces sp. MB22_4]|uniref:hypothetical protein n=1 Tax=Streptomyces TaxID=1883 RepID=UPI003686CAFA
MEHGGVARPFGWVHSIEIIDDVWLAERTTVQFSRCNMFIGPNDVGKTHFMSLLSGLSAPSHIMRRAKVPNSPVHAAINWYDPNPRRAEFKADGDHLQVSEDGVDVPFVVQPYQVITFPDHAWRISGRLSDVAHQLDLDLWAARRLLQNLPEIVDGAVKQVSIEGDLINAVVSSRGPGRLFRGERDRPLNSFIAIELLVALAETYARAKPTLLLLDGLLDAFPGPVFEQFSALLSSPARTFQTVATSVHPSALKNPEWTVTHFVFDPEVPRRNRGARPARLVQDDNPLHTYDQWRSVAKSEWRTYSEGEEIRRRWKVSHAGDTQPGTGIRPAGEARAPHGTR